MPKTYLFLDPDINVTALLPTYKKQRISLFDSLHEPLSFWHWQQGKIEAWAGAQPDRGQIPIPTSFCSFLCAASVSLSQLSTFTCPVSYPLCIQDKRLSSSAFPKSSLKSAVNYHAHSHSDQQKVGSVIRSRALLWTAHRVRCTDPIVYTLGRVRGIPLRGWAIPMYWLLHEKSV